MIYQFEYREITDCEFCPFHLYDRTDKMLYCSLTDNGSETNYASEQSWRLAIAELMLECPLEVAR